MKEKALRNLLRLFFRQASFANMESTSEFVEQWIKNNRYNMDVMTLIDDPKWEALRNKFFARFAGEEPNEAVSEIFEWIKTNVK